MKLSYFFAGLACVASVFAASTPFNSGALAESDIAESSDCTACRAKTKALCKNVKGGNQCTLKACKLFRPTCAGCFPCPNSPEAESESVSAQTETEAAPLVARDEDVQLASDCNMCHWETVNKCRGKIPRRPCMRDACNEFHSCHGCPHCGRVQPEA